MWLRYYVLAIYIEISVKYGNWQYGSGILKMAVVQTRRNHRIFILFFNVIETIWLILLSTMNFCWKSFPKRFPALIPTEFENQQNVLLLDSTFPSEDAIYFLLKFLSHLPINDLRTLLIISIFQYPDEWTTLQTLFYLAIYYSNNNALAGNNHEIDSGTILYQITSTAQSIKSREVRKFSHYTLSRWNAHKVSQNIRLGAYVDISWNNKYVIKLICSSRSWNNGNEIALAIDASGIRVGSCMIFRA